MEDFERMSDEEFSKFMDSAIADEEVLDDTIEIDVGEQEEDTSSDAQEEILDVEENLEDPKEEGSELVEEEENTEVEADDNVPATEEVKTEESTPIEDRPVETAPATWKIKADGIDFELTEKELKDLASKGINYTKKMQKMKPYSTIISSIEENKISKEELDLLISAYKGDKGAINEIIKKNNVDTFDLTAEENTYRPVSYGKSEVELEMLEVIGSIKNDDEFRITEHVLTNVWDDKSKDMLYKSFTDPRLKLKDGRTYLEGLHEDIRNGTYDKLAPVMMKKKVLDNGRRSDLEYYWEAAREVAEKEDLQRQIQMREEAVRAEERAKYEAQVQSQKAVSQAANAVLAKNRKAAGVPKTGGAKPVSAYIDISGMSDDEFSKYMEDVLRK